MANELGKKILELIPEGLHEDLIEEIKAQLIEQGVVKELPKKKELSDDDKKKSIAAMVDQLMPGFKKA